MKSLANLTPGQRCIEAIREIRGQVPLYADPTGPGVIPDLEERDMVRFFAPPVRAGLSPRTGLDGRVPPRGSGA